jgi:para-aminobenzoate synthetase component 1
VHALVLPEAIDPEAAALWLGGDPGLCWLDGDSNHRDGRFAFVASCPVERVRERWPASEPLAALARLDAGSTLNDAPCALPGAPLPASVPRYVGYIAYDACLASRGLPARGRAGKAVLDFARYDAVAAFDLVARRGFVLGDDRAACERLYERLMRAPRALGSARLHDATFRPANEHLTAIASALEHIARGDVYQVNLARELRARLSGAPLAFFQALRRASTVPLGMYYDDGERVIAARTMECFLRWDRASRGLRTRPIKGTLARTGDPTAARDAALAATLIGDEKERAEHAMIVDLMRNDLSRVAELGSVHLPGVFEVEPFARLLHLVSTVACTTRPEVGLRDVLEATFPPGSVTGAPKLAAVALIEALEAVPRDAYTGALGFVDRTGGLSLAVAIRTALIEGQAVRYFAGGGIVEASDPERELRETELKARVLLDAGDLLEAAEPAGPQENLGTRSFLR